jgi:hypothetical protein
VGELKFREHAEKIALIFRAVRAQELCVFAAFVERGIVSRRDIIAAVFEGELEHRAELYLSVADDAGVRGRSAQIFGGKIVHDLFFELAAQVEYAVLHFKSLRHIFRVLNVAVRAVAGL